MRLVILGGRRTLNRGGGGLIREAFATLYKQLSVFVFSFLCFDHIYTDIKLVLPFLG